MLKARRYAETAQRARPFTISSAEEHSSSELSFRRHTVVSLHRGDAASACGCTVYLGLSRDGDGVNNISAVGFLSFSATMYDIVQYHNVSTISYHTIMLSLRSFVLSSLLFVLRWS